MEFTVNKDSQYSKILNEYKLEKRAPMHSFHRYYGKLIPAIPNAFINEFTKENDTIFDPFTGSGTTAVEAQRLNRNFVGTEINPLSVEISKVKTHNYSTSILNNINEEILNLINNYKSSTKLKEDDFPFVINRDHWFKDYVQEDLIIIENSINSYFEKNPTLEDYKDFYYAVISAIIRIVSNADPQHVFPGFSKRMRKLEEEGKLNPDVFATFERAIKKRAEYYDIYENTTATSTILNTDFSNFDFSKYKNHFDLIVTNPPYISSVRYVETMKLELYWMRFIASSEQYMKLARKMLGNDSLLKKDYEEIEYTKYKEINDVIDNMKTIDMKSAKIIGMFFNEMEIMIKNMNSILKLNKKVVIKISDSRMKKMKIETGKFMSLIAQNYGFKIVDVFIDKINNNSRSLTTARNTYSDIITHDYIIIWEKINEIQ